MTDTCSLNVLPNEVLLMIFGYCNEYDLLRLSEVCKRFYEIVHTDVVWIKARKQFLVTNQMSERFRERYLRLCLTCIQICTQLLRVIKNDKVLPGPRFDPGLHSAIFSL